MHAWKLSLVGLVAALTGCGDPDCPAGTRFDGARCAPIDTDTGPDGAVGDGGDESDAAAMDSTVPEDAAVDCSSAVDGTACGSGAICLDGSCAPSRCGDGFVDVARGEQCEDGNETEGDGCEPVSCRLSCEDAEDCDDGNVCNGSESCDGSTHICQPGTPAATGTDCTRPGGDAGVCRSGLCVSPGCGNDVVDPGEDCDDGMNGDDTDGCRDDCSFTCTSAADCDDLDACNGAETCDTTTHTCQAGTAPDCDDSNACTADSCDASAGCVHTLIDADGDGFASGPCPTGTPDGDCDDTDDSVYPGAGELCDSVDNDCDDTIDEDPGVLCLRDEDGDGFGDPTDTMEACTCPAGYTPEPADGRTDCADYQEEAHPDQASFFPYGYSTSFPCFGLCSYDWNCDGTEEQRWAVDNVSGSACSYNPLVGDCFGDFGWLDDAPDCGQSGDYRVCRRSCPTCSCASSVISRTQECR